MQNTLTDEYSLIKVTTLDANFIQLLLGKTVNYNDGFCRELFRDGKHLRSLRSPSDTFSARKGDTMLSVNMGIVTVPFRDKIPTRDGYFLSYDATVRLLVVDPRIFAVCYVQRIDPLQKTIDIILAALKREVARGLHDDMSDQYLREVVENDTGSPMHVQMPWGPANVTHVVEYGVAILDAQTMSPHADPKRIEEIKEAQRVEDEKERLRKEREIELARMRKEQEIELARLEKREAIETEQMRMQDALARQQREIDIRKHDEALEDDRKQWEHEREKLEDGRRRDAALEMNIEAARQQFVEDRALLRRLREQGIPTATIVQEYPELLYLLERRDILDNKRVLNAAELEQINARIVQAESPTTHAVTCSDGIWTIGHFSMKVSPHVLSEHEAGLAQMPAQSLGYLVEELIGTGQHEHEVDPQPEDLIYLIDNQPVPKLDDLAPYLDERQQQGNAVKVTYLRGEISGVVTIVIPSAQR